jgi:glycyl-tRNA synthetase beta chain
LVYITEFPTPILGGFDSQYLELPREVLVTVMRHHQKYLSVEDAAGNLAPHFIAVINSDSDSEGLISRGNGRVLRARFNDARFFWQVDQKRKLEERLPDLKAVTFQAKLGSYFEKTERVVALVRQLGGTQAAERAALLSKCDLTTDMVKEFTDLQGIVGGLYARAQGEPPEVWQAIYDHYKPLNMDDSVPSTIDGCTVSLADKLDTLKGCFGVGLIPSGSKDPFGLRRAAQGVVKILDQKNYSLDVLAYLGDDEGLHAFFADRVRYYFSEILGFSHDVVNAAVAAGWGNILDLRNRLGAIKAIRQLPDFRAVAASFRRIKRILPEGLHTASVDVRLLEDGPERSLYSAICEVKGAVGAYKNAGRYFDALHEIASLRPKVDLFFDKVLVNAPDEAVRRNRLMLLNNLLTEFSEIADFSEIVTERETTNEKRETRNEERL